MSADMSVNVWQVKVKCGTLVSNMWKNSLAQCTVTPCPPQLKMQQEQVLLHVVTEVLLVLTQGVSLHWSTSLLTLLILVHVHLLRWQV